MSAGRKLLFTAIALGLLVALNQVFEHGFGDFQINAYYAQLGEGLLENVGPLVETHLQEKPLSIAMREINEGLLTLTHNEES